MAKPVLLAVDDDAQVRTAVRGDLQARYARDYRIILAEGGVQALTVVEELHRRGDDLALFLVDERMPEMTGTAFLTEARDHYPDARKVLLTAYADTEAAIRSINEIGLDHYLLKPWSPPEEHLYPIIDELLEDWLAERPPPFDGIRIVGARWSAPTYELKEFLARNGIPYRFLDIERDSEAETLLETTHHEALLPVVFLPDGEVLERPTTSALASHVGLRIQASAPLYDLVVIGAGPAGLAAAVYGASEGLSVAVLERHATGGQAGTSARIENYLGFPKGVSGLELARRAVAQATRFGAEIISPVEVQSIEVGENTRTLTLANGESIVARAVLVASGMKVRKLDVPGFERLTGAGVYYGGTRSEAVAYRDERVAILGGANSAGQAAVMFAEYAKEVVVLVRSATLAEGMSQYLVDQIEATDNVRVLTRVEVEAVDGGDHLERVELHSMEGERTNLDVSGLFVFIGAVPHTDFLQGVVTLNEHGFVLTGPDLAVSGERPKGWRLQRDPYLLESSVPGIFAAGDVRNGAVRRVASAVGQGAVAVSLVHQYLASA